MKVGELLRAIDGYDGQPTTGAALRLAPYVFVRPTELRAAEWSEMTLDGEQPEWRIPAEPMKMREAHIVPLARQSVDILRALRPITGRQGYVFPAIGGGWTAAERKHPQWRNSTARLLRRGNDCSRVPDHGEHIVERAGCTPRTHRVATRTRRTEHRWGCLQPRATIGRASRNDAEVG